MTKKHEQKDWESWIDEQIREAQERGQFDNLPGKGRPLNLAPNPYAGDMEMAFKMLRDAGYAPEWIELDKAIRLRLERARIALARAWTGYQEATRELQAPASPGPLRAGGRRLQAGRERAAALRAWQAAVAAFEREAAAINLMITELNLKVPGSRFQRSKVDAGREVRSLEEGLT